MFDLNLSESVRKVSNSVMKVSDGTREVSDGIKKVLDCVKKVTGGVWKASNGVNKVSVGVMKVTDSNRLGGVGRCQECAMVSKLSVRCHCTPRNQEGTCAAGEIRQNIKFAPFWCVFLTTKKGRS